VHRIVPSKPADYVLDLYARGAKKIIYSLDDNVIDPVAQRQFLEDSGGLTHAAIDKIVDRIPQALHTIELCDEVLVTTIELAEIAFEKTTKSVQVLQNALDENWYIDALSTTPEYIGNSNLVYIGYASGRRPESDLVQMARAWKRISDDFSNVRFVVAGWQPDIIDQHIDLDRKIRIPFKNIEQWPMSMQVDIGCCPLADTPFNRGKSPIKYYEYTMAGAAVVASRLVYQNVMHNYMTGFFADTEDEWYKYLGRLVTMWGLRKQYQETAYYDIHNYRTLEATIQNWEAYFERLLS
jgi:glycosyltransferase involved in cell wall biosynthesis